ncbi:hypothetical protein COCMIDRAFT_95276, partial [Bipolaris oryzae ATCC 44560]
SFFQSYSELGCLVLRVVLHPLFLLGTNQCSHSNTCTVYVVFFFLFKIAQHLLCSSCWL